MTYSGLLVAHSLLSDLAFRYGVVVGILIAIFIYLIYILMRKVKK